MKYRIKETDLVKDLDSIYNIDQLSFKHPWKQKKSYKKYNINFILKKGEKIIGFLIADDNDTYCHLHKIVISAEYRNKGLGKYLIYSLLNKSKKTKFKLNVRESNTKAINFYKKLGFELVKITEAYYKKTGDTNIERTALTMLLDLEIINIEIEENTIANKGYK